MVIIIKEYLLLFFLFSKIGLMTFGGGIAGLPILKSELVDKKHWIDEDELADFFAIGQCTPGIIAVNTATFIGYKRKGALGGFVATFGLIFPSFVLVSIVASVLSSFMHLQIISYAFAGIRVFVCALVLNVIINMFKNSVRNIFSFVVFAVTFILNAFFSVSPVILVLSCAVAGVTYGVVRGARE